MRDSPRDRMQETATNKGRGNSRKPMIHDADSLRARMRKIVAYKRRHNRTDSREANPCQIVSREADSMRVRTREARPHRDDSHEANLCQTVSREADSLRVRTHDAHPTGLIPARLTPA